MSGSSGISLPQWYASYGMPSVPLFRDDGVPVRETLAAGHAFAVTTATAQEIRASGAPALWPGAVCAKLSRVLARTAEETKIGSLIVLVEYEYIATVNNACDSDLEFLWAVARACGQQVQIE